MKAIDELMLTVGLGSMIVIIMLVVLVIITVVDIIFEKKIPMNIQLDYYQFEGMPCVWLYVYLKHRREIRLERDVKHH